MRTQSAAVVAMTTRQLTHRLFARRTGGLSGVLVYMNNSGCPNDPFPTIPSLPDSQSGVILLIERGGCHFVRKVYSAQQAGATAVLIRNDMDLCGEGSCARVNCKNQPVFGGPGSCPQRMPFLSDDGTGRSVNIPSFMIKRSNGTALINCLSGTSAECANGNNRVRISLKWNMPIRRADGKPVVTGACVRVVVWCAVMYVHVLDHSHA